MPEFRYKDLDALKAAANITIPESTPYEKCHVLMRTLAQRIKEERSKQQYEMEYIHLHRYMTLFKYWGTKKNTAKKGGNRKLELPNLESPQLYLRRYEHLQEILKEKYESLNQSKISREIQLQPMPASNAATNNSANNNKVSEWTLKNSQATGVIECNQLYSLLNNRRAKELIILLDVRRSGDFAASHVKADNVANIPEEILTPGLSAQNLGKKLTGRSAELWDKRADADALILMDWFSSSKSTNRNSTVFILQNIIKQWDPLTAYKSPPILLEGGFEELLERYPQTVTNPRVAVPRRPDESSVNPLVPEVDILYPIDVLEPERPKTSVPPPVVEDTQPNVPRSAPAVVDRSNKPQLQSKDDQPEYQADPLADSFSEDGDDVPMDVDDAQMPAGDRPRDNMESFDQTLPPPLASSTVLLDKTNHEKTDKEDVHPENPSSRKPDPSEVENLRKLKPSSAPKSVTPQPTNNNGISRVPLKKDGAPSGILRRTSSFPNMQQIRDDEPVGPTVPTFSRALKNVSPKKTFLYSDSDFHRPDATYGKTVS
ncbi:Hypothetical protein NTJ_14633 [Nesidiocoris tenuis]|nr:Hypothetical protein NTJ_14633 [Nesidiocoris tenuis]